jgi:hypothetical protein
MHVLRARVRLPFNRKGTVMSNVAAGCLDCPLYYACSSTGCWLTHTISQLFEVRVSRMHRMQLPDDTTPDNQI